MKRRSCGTLRRTWSRWGEPLIAKAGMTCPVAVGNDALGARFGLTAMPLTWLIDRQGRVAVAHAGIVDRAAFERDIQELLR